MKKLSFFALLIILVAGLTACGPPKWEEERGLGKVAEESGDLDQAIKHYKKAVKLKSDYSDAIEDLERTEELYWEASREEQRKSDAKREEEEQEKNNTQPLLDIEDVANKTESEVKDILGEPSESESGELSFDGTPTDYNANYYNDGKIDIMFIDGKSTNIRLSLSEEEYFDGNDIEKNLLYVGLPVKDMSIDVVADGQMFANSYSFDDIYRVEISRWRGSPGGFVFIIANEEYEY